jgi:hypothetical protein
LGVIFFFLLNKNSFIPNVTIKHTLTDKKTRSKKKFKSRAGSSSEAWQSGSHQPKYVVHSMAFADSKTQASPEAKDTISEYFVKFPRGKIECSGVVL